MCFNNHWFLISLPPSLSRLSLIKAKSGKHQNNNSDLERQTEIDVKCLQILRASIYNKIILINEEDKEREPKKYRKYVCMLHAAKSEKKSLIASITIKVLNLRVASVKL